MENNPNPLRIVAECCASCQFFVNHVDGSWCIFRYDVGISNPDLSYVKPYYVCDKLKLPDLASLSMRYDTRLVNARQYSSGFSLWKKTIYRSV